MSVINYNACQLALTRDAKNTYLSSACVIYLMTYDNTPAENLFLAQSSVKFNMSAERVLFGCHFLPDLFYNLALEWKNMF